MKFARVIGNTVATQKDERFEGRKMLIIQPVDINFQPEGSYLVAIDAVQAGVGELVLYATGSSARQTDLTKDRPCDCVIIGIIDLVEVKGKTIFNKSSDPEIKDS